MSDTHPIEDFRQWLKQRIEAGEDVSLAVPLQPGRRRAAQPSAEHTESLPQRESLSGAAQVLPQRVSGSGAAEVAAQRESGSGAAQLLPQRESGSGAAQMFPRQGPTSASKPAARVPAASTRASGEPPQPLDPAPDGDSLEKIAAEVRACTRCRLHETRTNAVPGVGPEDAGLVFIGEGPGADEDRQGEPFVGRAGQLLTRIIESVELERPSVFITNIVKCRPPKNRDPRPDEVAACEPFLKRQLSVLQPSVICALGRHASVTLLHKDESMARLRTGEHFYEGVRVFPTYHPAALLRNPQWKRPVWEDIQNIRRAYDVARENP